MTHAVQKRYKITPLETKNRTTSKQSLAKIYENTEKGGR